ncbi:MAG: Spy/CpxP family protein refolding chaperone [Acidobacteriia bacterium]|nr:Spy/CpxP family protein refolding chaperone [Terriglobia bacterium]
MKLCRYFALIPLLTGGLVLAQQPPEAPEPPALPAPAARPPEAPPPPRPGRPPMERAFHPGPPGRWWNNPDMAQKLGLTAEQQKRMDEIFQQHRLKLIDLNASLQREEAILEPLMEGDQPDESKILAQIDRVAQSRAELEKANARMLLGIRRVLNPDQWKKLQAEAPRPRPHPTR